MKTQKQLVLEYVKRHYFITRREAALKLDTMNLWARVAELEEDGFRFDRRKYTTAKGRKVLQYWLRNVSQRRSA